MSKIFLKGIATKSDKGTYRVLASTNAVDRQGDVVDQNGWELDNFLKNPVILWAHRYDELPVGKAVSIGKGVGGLELEFEFASAEGNPKAQQVKTLFEEGFLNAVSVGFIPKERNGNIITRSELLEVSVVPVPANQEALRLAMSKGLNVKDIADEIEKGEVADVIDSRDKMEQKYEKLDEVWNIVSAFCGVYCKDETPVEDFSRLLLETIGLLTKVANGETVDKPEEETINNAFIGKKTACKHCEVVEKEGRVLSKKNKELISNCKETMSAGIAVLEELLKATDSSTEGDGKAVDETVAVDEKPITLSFDEAMALIRQNARTVDKASEVTLSIINRFQEGRNKK